VGNIKGEAEARERALGDAAGERERLLMQLRAREQELEHYKAEVARCGACCGSGVDWRGDGEARRGELEHLRSRWPGARPAGRWGEVGGTG
jgi:hypothetical protein